MSVISPVEALGLAGAALDARMKNAASHVSDATLARIADRLRADAFQSEIIYEHENGKEAVRIMLRPLLAQREQLSYVGYVCNQITEALQRLPEIYFSDPDVKRILRIGAQEEEWLKEIWSEAHARNNPVYGRLDAVCDFASPAWADTLKFMEPNLSGVGGIHYSPVAEQLVMRDVVPTLLAHDPGVVIELPQDQRDLFIQVLIDHARAIGREQCRLCFIEPKYEAGGPDEQGALSRYLSERHGLSISHADPRELEVIGNEVTYKGQIVDVAYRDYEVRDMIALEKELGRRLDGMRLLLKQNRVCSSLVGDFDHKSGFEILTDPKISRRLFAPEDCRLFERHVLWTRLCADRVTSLPGGEAGSLLDYARAHREQLVLKPNRAYGGEGVMLGMAMGSEEWEAQLAQAAALGDDPDRSFVLQSATQIPVAEFPVLGPDRRVHNEPFYAVMGFAATEGGLGVLCRVSQKKVVNVAQHGGLATVLIAEPPRELKIGRRPARAAENLTRDFRSEVKTLLDLDRAIAVLEWDEETNLPPEGHAQRGSALGTLEAMRHAHVISDRFGDLIEETAFHNPSDERLMREIALLRRQRKRAHAVPESLVRELAGRKSQAFAAWEEARAADSFLPFATPLAELVRLVRERARCLADDGALYDALLEDYEPGLTLSRLEPVLGELKDRLVPLVFQARANWNGPSLKGRVFALPQQWELSREVLTAMGFDFARGRLDPSTHPFTMSAGADDVRVTSRMAEDDLSAGLLATLHEGGHGLYDQGFARSDAETLLGDGASSAMHEGQARLWENHVGRSRAFAAWLAPRLARVFGQEADKRDLDEAKLYAALNTVAPGLIRVAADELTYHLHIALRTELEIALIGGGLSIGDLPAAWSERSKALLGIAPKSDRDGVLQDVHWSATLFGYFPTYSLGNLYAAQLIETYSKTHDLDAEVRAGNFSDLRGFLDKAVYEKGARFEAEDIMREATGVGLDTGAFFRYVEGKFG